LSFTLSSKGVPLIPIPAQVTQTVAATDFMQTKTVHSHRRTWTTSRAPRRGVQERAQSVD